MMLSALNKIAIYYSHIDSINTDMMHVGLKSGEKFILDLSYIYLFTGCNLKRL